MTPVDFNTEIGNEEEGEVNLERIQWTRALRQKIVLTHCASNSQYSSITELYAEEPFQKNRDTRIMGSRRSDTRQMNDRKDQVELDAAVPYPLWKEIAMYLDRDVEDDSDTMISDKPRESNPYYNPLSETLATRVTEFSHRLNSYLTEGAHGERNNCPDIDALEAYVISPDNLALAAHLEECIPCRSELQILKDTARITSDIAGNRDNPDYIFSGICYELDEKAQETEIDDDDIIDCEPCGIFMQMDTDHLWAAEGAVSRDADIDGHMDATADNQSSQSAEMAGIMYDYGI